MCNSLNLTEIYGFGLFDLVCHIKDSSLVGIVTEIDSDFDLGGITTVRVAWGATSKDEAFSMETDIQWSNKLIKVTG